MKQVLQHPGRGVLRVMDVPPPALLSGRILVRNRFSAVSSGTERQMLEFGRRSLLGKALARPDLARKVIAAAKSEGIGEAIRQARGRLHLDTPLGYSSAGTVIEVAPDVSGFTVGDRVACSGSGFASHGEIVSVPAQLCARIPDGVSEEDAAFGAVGAISLHALELAEIEPGDVVAIIGLGLLGLIAVQIATARGNTVVGLDVDPKRAVLARALGAARVSTSVATDSAQALSQLTDDRGAAAVLIFAATPSNQPIELAAALARDRGTIVVPGLVGLNLPRRVFFAKELGVRVSRAWGEGFDGLPVGPRGVRARRTSGPVSAGETLAAFLSLVDERHVHLEPLVSHRFPVDQAEAAYQALETAGTERPLGVLLSYEAAIAPSPARTLHAGSPSPERGERGPALGLIGAGTFARATLLPAVQQIGDVRLVGVAAATGATARSVADTFGFEYCTTDIDRILADEAVNWVMIATPHHLHARQVVRALESGKHVFVEKPLALTERDLKAVVGAARRSSAQLMVGFNRRFAPATLEVQRWLSSTAGPASIMCRVNSNPVPPRSWIRDPRVGGGRILGEVCHFVDLVQHLAGSRIREVRGCVIPDPGGGPAEDSTAVLTCADGTIGTIVYTTLGTRTFPRERIEIFRGGSVCVIDDFRRATLTREQHTATHRRWGVDRGHRAELGAFIDAIRSGHQLATGFEEAAYSTLATICLEEATRTGAAIDVHARWRAMQADYSHTS